MCNVNFWWPLLMTAIVQCLYLTVKKNILIYDFGTHFSVLVKKIHFPFYQVAVFAESVRDGITFRCLNAAFFHFAFMVFGAVDFSPVSFGNAWNNNARYSKANSLNQIRYWVNDAQTLLTIMYVHAIETSERETEKEI